MAAQQDLTALSAVELRRRIGAKQVSPVELREACIERIERLNPKVNAIAATDFARARKEAKAAETAVMRGEPLGLLHGLPTGIKDLDETAAGLLSTFGSPHAMEHTFNAIPALRRPFPEVGKIAAAPPLKSIVTHAPAVL